MIAFRAAGVNALTAGVTSTTITLPAGTQKNDLLIAWCEIGSIVTNFTTPAGWTQFSWSPVIDGVNSNAFAFWKIAAAGEPNPAISWTTSSKGVIVCVGYSGVDIVTPLGNNNVNIETASQTTATTPSLAAVANEWAVTIHSSRTSTSANKAPTWTAPSGETSRNQSDNSAAAAAPWDAVACFDSNGVVTVASHSYTATSNFTESHHKSALIYINNVAPQLTDSITAADAVTRTLSLPRALAESFTTSDTATRTVALATSATDVFTTADAATERITAARSATDAFTAADTATENVSLPRAVTDTWTTADTAARSTALPRPVTDTIGLSDTATRSLVLSRAVADGWLTADQATRSIVVLRTATDAWTTADVAEGTVLHPVPVIFTFGRPGSRWSLAAPASRWTTTAPTTRWAVTEPMTQQFSALAVQLVPVPVQGKAAGQPINPTVDTVYLAFMDGRAEPGNSDWVTGSWDTTATPGVYLAQALIGPGTSAVLTPGTYSVWVKIVDDPETPVFQCGAISIY